MRMVSDEYDHMSSIFGRMMFGHVINHTPMVADLLMGLYVENNFFVNYCSGVVKTLHILV